MHRPTDEQPWRPLADRLRKLLGRRALADGDHKTWHGGGPVITIATPDRDRPLPLRLPPFTEDDLDRVESEWQYLPTDFPRWVVALDRSAERWLLPTGWDASLAQARVRFPSLWPSTPCGRGEIHTQHDIADFRAVRALGDAARPSHWLLRVQAWRPDASMKVDEPQPGGYWGLIDIDGRLVLPMAYAHLGVAEGLLGTLSRQTAPPLPVGRLQSWQWAEVITASMPATDAYGREVCDVIEVWTGQRVNPHRIKALRGSLAWGYFTACHDATSAGVGAAGGVEVGLMLCTQAAPGPLRWAALQASAAVNSAMTPARCAVTGLYGYVGALGQTVLEPEFDAAWAVDSGLAKVRLTLADAQAQGCALTLADGKQIGSIGVLEVARPARAGQSPPWRWLLAPRWRDVGGEYDGHLSVQDVSGAWGMVTPDGDVVSPFSPREPRGGLDDDPHEQVRQQFRVVQARRFMGWLVEAARLGTLAAMQGRLHSSYAAYDHGALPHLSLAVWTTRAVVARVMKVNPTRDEDVTLPVGTPVTWDPSARNYAGFVDLRSHAVVGQPGEHDHATRIPWDALALAVPAPNDGLTDPEGLRLLEALSASAHGGAMRHLVLALDRLTDWLEVHRIAPNPCAPALANRAAASSADGSESRLKWDAQDALRACSNVAVFLRQVELCLALCDARRLAEAVRMQRHWLSEVDLPTLFTRQRYERADAMGTGTRVAHSVPLWIGNEGGPAIPANHPWVKELAPLWRAALEAYWRWWPLWSSDVHKC